MTKALSINQKSVLFIHAGAEMYGADKILLILCDQLIQRGWRVVVVLPWNGELGERLREVGASVHTFNHGVLRRKYFTPCGLLNRSILLTKAVARLKRLVVAEGVQVIHSNTSVVLAGAIAARVLGLPHVWHIHEITTRPKVVWKALSWLFPRLSEKVVCVSDAVLNHLIAGNARNSERGVVVRNGIYAMQSADDARCRIRGELGVADDQVLVAVVGRVNAWKGQQAFLDAARLVLQGNSNVVFLSVGGTFAGEEHLLEALIQRAASSEFAGKVKVLGFRQDVSDILAATDLFVLPSIQPDPLPTVVLEAMSHSKPVVGFRHGGICEMVEDGATGLLADPCEPMALAAAMERFVRDARMREEFGRAARARYETHFSVPAFVTAMEGIYHASISG